MELTVFAKKRTTTEGKRFYIYLTQLIRKEDGEHVSVQVKFPEGLAPKADNCPLNITVDKDKANLSTKKVATDNGEITSRTLWVKDYMISKNPFEDSSLDDYE
nr:MAG TPA: hypothetical protein [Caudoviricetes sp.]